MESWPPWRENPALVIACGRRRSFPGWTERRYPYNAPETILAKWYLWRGELDLARDLLNAVIAVAERHGSDQAATQTRGHLVEAEWRAGNWDTAAAHAAAVARWGRETGDTQQEAAAYYLALIDAGRGNTGHARGLAAAGLEQAEAEQDWMYAAHCRWVLGQLELSVDAPAAALRWLEPIADMLQSRGIGEPGCYPFTPDLIEAWAATGHLDARPAGSPGCRTRPGAWTTPGRGSPAAGPGPPCGWPSATRLPRCTRSPP